MLHWRKNSGMFPDKAERMLTLAVSQVVKLMWQKYMQVRPKCLTSLTPAGRIR